MQKQGLAYIYAAVSVLLWSSVATVFKLALNDLPVVVVLFYSSAFSTAILFIVLIAQGKTGLLIKQERKDMRYSALVGLLNPFIYYLILFQAYSLLLAQVAQPLNYTWAIVLSIMSAIIFGQRMGARDMISLILGLAGVLIISTGGNLGGFGASNPFGVVLALSSSLVWAAMWILNMRDRRDAVLKLFMGFLFGTVYISLLVLFTAPIYSLAIDSLHLFYVAYIGLFEMGLTFVLWLTALELSGKSSSVAVLIYFSPFLSLVFIHFILGENIMLSSVLGLFLIVAGVLLERWSKRLGGDSGETLDEFPD